MEYLYLMNELDAKVKEAIATKGEDDPNVAEINTVMEMITYFLGMTKKEAADLITWAEFANYGNEFEIKLNDLRRHCRHYVV